MKKIKTKRQHLESYQKRYLFNMTFFKGLFRLMKVAICTDVFILICLSLSRYNARYHVMVIILIVSVVICPLFALLLAAFTNIDEERKKVRKDIASLSGKVWDARVLFEQNTKDKNIDSNDWTAEHITMFKKYKNLESKLFKKQAYLQMIGG